MVIVLFIISSLAFVLLAGVQFNLQYKVVEEKQSTISRSSVNLLLGIGTLLSISFCGASLMQVLPDLLSNSIPNGIQLVLAFLLFIFLGFLLLALAYRIFSRKQFPSSRVLKNYSEEGQKSPAHLDTNPALDYFKVETEEEKDSAELLDNAMNLFSIPIIECLIPRNEIVAIDLNTDLEEVKNTFIESKHSKLIVFENDIDNILGYVHHSDFYQSTSKLEGLIREIPTVPETMTAIEMLSFFKKKQKSIAWVVDEFGGTAGILTTEDLLEELFGEIEDEHDESEYIEQQISADEFILSGRLEVEYINDKFDLEIPTESAETLSGYIIEVHNEIPEKDEKIIIDSYEYKILQVSKTRIETIRLKVLAT